MSARTSPSLATPPVTAGVARTAAHTTPEAARRGPSALDLLGVVALTCAGPVLLLSAVALLRSGAATPEGSLARLVGLGAGVIGALLLAWWGVGMLGVALMTVGRFTGRRAWVDVGMRVTPSILRRTAAGILGLQLLTAPGAWADAPAASTGTPPAAVDASWLAPDTALDGGTASPRSARPAPVPSSTWTPTPPAPTPPGAATSPRWTAERDALTVRSGDCLWDIAAAELGPDATLREIDRRWRDWYRENAEVIGEDPDLLLPGTVLTAPVFSPHAHEDPTERVP